MMVYEYNFHTILLNVIFIPEAIPSKRVKFIPFFQASSLSQQQQQQKKMKRNPPL